MSKRYEAGHLTRVSTPDGTTKQQSLKILLNSHLSIYNALTNPQLDVSVANTPRLTPDLKDSQFSITSWQSLSNDSAVQVIHEPSSVLSITTEEEDTGNCIEEAANAISGNIMVFDTDEEDGDEEFPCDNSSAFIMPKISVFSKRSKFEITVLSCDNRYKIQTNQWIQRIQQELKLEHINIRHLNLVSNFSHHADLVIKNSDLVFIVNDGSYLFVECLTQIYDHLDKNSLPKLTIINMVTVNYFINLFELITNLKPYQIWKASSLKQEHLFDKFKNFVDLEVSQSSIQSSETSQFNEASDEKHFALINSSKSLSVVVNLRPNYKMIEKQFKEDLSLSTSFNDPFQLTSKFPFLQWLVALIRRSLFSSNSRIFLICSFGVGLGIGFSKVLSACFLFFTKENSVPDTPVIDRRNVIPVDFKGYVAQKLSVDVPEIIDQFSFNIKMASSMAMNSARGGLDKVFGFIV